MAGRVVCFGELLLRLAAPGNELLLQRPHLDVHVGGAEANVAVALAGFGHAVAMAGTLADNALGRRRATSCAATAWTPRRSPSQPGRMGLYFYTTGAGQRPSEVLYDRAHSAFADAAPGDHDWPALLAGARLLHLSGITPRSARAPHRPHWMPPAPRANTARWSASTATSAPSCGRPGTAIRHRSCAGCSRRPTSPSPTIATSAWCSAPSFETGRSADPLRQRRGRRLRRVPAPATHRLHHPRAVQRRPPPAGRVDGHPRWPAACVPADRTGRDRRPHRCRRCLRRRRAAWRADREWTMPTASRSAWPAACSSTTCRATPARSASMK